MRYAIKVNLSEGCPNVASMARDFIRALEHEGHGVIRVFFYHEGVRQAFGVSAAEWGELAQQGQFDLVLCSQALDQRGFTLEDQNPFVVGGLALWVDACLKADRVVSFGAPLNAG